MTEAQRRSLMDRRRWLPAIGLALLAAFVAVGWVQYRQITLLSSSVRYDSDYLVWSFFQLETELRQLQDELRESSHHPEKIDADALRTRYELFASRVPLIDESRTLGSLDLGPTHRQGLAALRDFMSWADPVMSESANTTLTPALLEDALQQVSALLTPVHDLTLRANQLNAELVGRRNDAVREQIRLGIGLTVFLCLLTLAFAALSARQVRMLLRRRRELELSAEGLQLARAEAEAASLAKSAFLANMSHELRTPLNGVLGMLSLLEPGRLDGEQVDQVRTARESATHLLDLLNDILDLSKLESGQLEVTPEPLNLQRLLHDVQALMRLNAESRGLQLVVQADPGLPGWLLGDGKRIKQVLFNLLSNAVKFTEQGEVSLHADLLATGHDTGPTNLRFRVTDSGIGIDAATLAKLFQRFVQADAGISRRYGGTGLGLEISRTLARLMGGDITVESRLGAGSTFTFMLPLQVAAAPTSASTLPSSHLPGGTAGATTAAAGALDLLVADDHATNRKFMLTLLRRLGHRVRVAEDGAAAVQAVKAQVPDLVFMDLHMPVMDGLQATQHIRALPGAAAATRIVAVTADAFRETRDRLLAAGMDGFLAKPVQTSEIEELLAAQFPERQAAWAHAAQALVQSAPAPSPTGSPAAAPKAPRRRFRPGELPEHIDMATVGEVCVGISLDGYRSVLKDILNDEAGSLASLTAALAAKDTSALKALAHAVKGSYGNVGLKGMQEVARHIEFEGGNFTAEDCAAQSARLQASRETAVALCQRMGLA